MLSSSVPSVSSSTVAASHSLRLSSLCDSLSLIHFRVLSATRESWYLSASLLQREKPGKRRVFAHRCCEQTCLARLDRGMVVVRRDRFLGSHQQASSAVSSLLRESPRTRTTSMQRIQKKQKMGSSRNQDFFKKARYRAIALTLVMSKWFASCIIVRLEQERTRKMEETTRGRIE